MSQKVFVFFAFFGCFVFVNSAGVSSHTLPFCRTASYSPLWNAICGYKAGSLGSHSLWDDWKDKASPFHDKRSFFPSQDYGNFPWIKTRSFDVDDDDDLLEDDDKRSFFFPENFYFPHLNRPTKFRNIRY